MGVPLTQSAWNERRFLVRSTVGGLLFYTLFAVLLPTKYRSTARLITRGVSNSSALCVALLQSRNLQDRLIKRFDLRTAYRDPNWTDARIDLEKHSKITADSKNGIITIATWDEDPDRAADLVQGRMDGLNLLVMRMDSNSAHRERAVLENRVAGVQQDLALTQVELSNYASNNLLAGMDGQEQEMINALGGDYGKSTVEKEELQDQESIYANESTPDPSTQPHMETRDNLMIKVVNDVQRKLIADQADLESLKQTYGDHNTQVRAAQAKVGQLQRELTKLIGKSNPPGSINQNPQSLFPSLRQLPLIGTGYADLYRPVAIDEAVFDRLTQEDELAKVAEANNTPTITILDPPEVPENKSWPLRFWIIFLSTIGSFSLAISWIFGTLCWQRWPQDAQKLFAMEVLQTIAAYFQVGMNSRWRS
jgi:uncharacterized protein involved in exopolysaccharide biosynthesis